MPPQFWETLLELDDQVEVKPLKDGEVWKGASTWTNAFIGDPLMNYMKGDEPDTPRSIRAQKLFMSGFLLGWIHMHSKIVITVNGGTSLVVAELAPSSVGRGKPMDKLIGWLVKSSFKFLGRLGSRERKRRRKEVREKRDAVVKDKIGDRYKDMILVSLVCTDPGSQGHGYASALLDTVTRLADILDTACWLESSNALNEPFYNSHGFKTVGEAVIGDHNPSWHEKPFPVQIMIREPLGRESRSGVYTDSISTGGSMH
ncbi:hypothetical protein BKA70DRAFT_1257881 [Coprinopsis sp. MPI-PUGE-AT-0042]|nr:hypothetical protein BKA70DRAFT_1257881 [Coprinopsis sp. MPI-PUGE-AT-0042]